MANYTLKDFDAVGRLVGRFEFFAHNDYEAEALVQKLAGARTRELWCGRRWVQTWPARALAAAA